VRQSFTLSANLRHDFCGWGYNNAPGTTNCDPTYNYPTYAGLPTTPESRMPEAAIGQMLPIRQGFTLTVSRESERTPPPPPPHPSSVHLASCASGFFLVGSDELAAATKGSMGTLAAASRFGHRLTPTSADVFVADADTMTLAPSAGDPASTQDMTEAELPAARQTAIDQMSDEISTGLVMVGLVLAMLSVLPWLRTPAHHGLSLDIRRPALPLSVFLLLLVSTAAVAQATTSTVAGMSNLAGNIMAVGTSAKFSAPRGIALSPSADIALLADTNNNNIKHIDLTTWAVTLFAGNAGGASGAPLSLSPRPLASPSLSPHALSGSRALSPRPLPRCALPPSPLLPRPRRPVGQRVTI